MSFALPSFTFWIRWMHIAAMALVLGGALLLWGASLRTRNHEQQPLPTVLPVAWTYEWLFWAGLGTLVMTGVGNLGVFGAALPAPAGPWGVKLIAKLLLVLLLMGVSVVRTLLVTRLHAQTTAIGPALLPLLRRFYAGTTLLLAAILLLAVSLAHGGSL